MKQSVGAPGRLASAQSVRTLRRNSCGIAEKTCVSISRGGVSRYIIVVGHLLADRRTIKDRTRGVDWPRPAFVATRREDLLRKYLLRKYLA